MVRREGASSGHGFLVRYSCFGFSGATGQINGSQNGVELVASTVVGNLKFPAGPGEAMHIFRVPSPNRYMAVARFCFCKNNKRTIDRSITFASGGWGYPDPH
jgi:hypothetical protein